MPTEQQTEILSDEQLKEIEAHFHLTTDGDAVFVLSRAPALCQTVRALRKELSEAYYESCEICDQEIVSGDGTKIHTFAVGGCCWNKSQETIAALRDQLAQSEAENERLASQLKEWQEDKDTKAGYL